MEYAAGGAGATLGYIWNNIPGAIDGYRAGTAIYRNRYPSVSKKEMPPIMKRKSWQARNAKGSRPTKKFKYGKKGSGSPPALTVQHDYRQTYRKKYMPKKKKAAWKKFTKKVLAVANRDRGLVTALFNTRIIAPEPAVPGNQTLLCCHLYGYNGTSSGAECGSLDLLTLVNNNQELRGYELTNNFAQVTLQNQSTSNATEKIMFESAVLDMTLYNSSLGTLEVDIYTIEYNKFNNCTDTRLLPSFGSGDVPDVAPVQYGLNLTDVFANIKLLDRGATPFEMGTIISRHGIRIKKKEKFYISQGQSINKQFRDPRNRYFDPRGLTGQTASAESVGTYKYKDYTKTFLVVAKNVNPGQTTPAAIECGVTRSYKYTYEGLKVNKNYYASF